MSSLIFLRLLRMRSSSFTCLSRGNSTVTMDVSSTVGGCALAIAEWRRRGVADDRSDVLLASDTRLPRLNDCSPVPPRKAAAEPP